MQLSIVKNVGLLVLAVVGIASRADAGIITVPPGLAPGSQYRLAFFTTDDFNAESSTISDYNTMVTTEANAVAALAALSTTWFDIGSTESVSAITNIGIDSGVPIYDLEGHRIAADAGTDAGGLFSGTLGTSIDFDPTGAYPTVWVLTGSNTSGTQAAIHELGAGFITEVGITENDNPGEWIAADSEVEHHLARLYGISGVLTVSVSSVPEPATTGMVLAGGALMFCARRRIHRNRRATRPLC
jgi:hypothetical protein